jgi:hypothetical protein
MALLLAGISLSVLAEAAGAARPATAAEAGAILRAAGSDPDGPGFTSGCVQANVRVSGSYAFVSFTFRNTSACVRYAFDGSNALRKTTAGWKQVFVGSEVPSCSLGLPADLTPCRPLSGLASQTALGYERAVLQGDVPTACSFLSGRGLAALRRHLGQPGTAGCPTVMRAWAGEPNHGLPDDIARLRVLSAQVRGASAVVVVGGLNGLLPTTLRLHERAGHWFVDAPIGRP